MKAIDIAQQKYDDMEPEDDEFFDSDFESAEFDEPGCPEPDDQASFERSP